MLAAVRGRAAAPFAGGTAPAVQAPAVQAPARRVSGCASPRAGLRCAPARTREEVTLGRRARVLIDLAPLRRSRDLRPLVFGGLVSVPGSPPSTVAGPDPADPVTHS